MRSLLIFEQFVNIFFIAVVLSESNPDIDKVLMNLDAKDFTLEASVLPSLQQLIQWVSDLALNILTRLPVDTFKTVSSFY